MKPRIVAVLVLSAVSVSGLGMALSPRSPADIHTPDELVAAYGSLADAILAVKRTEHDLVGSILAATYHEAADTAHRALTRMGAGEDASGDIEALAALVAQLGTEGDTAVAGVRKRLLEGGHHHNAAGEAQGLYDEGFVIVTRKAKEVLLNSARRIAAAGDAAALKKEWALVQETWKSMQGGN